MVVVFLCMEVGAFKESFAGELAAALDVRLLDLRPLDLSIAELRAFDADRSRSAKQPSSVIDDLSIRAAKAALDAAVAGNVLIVGWSAATVLASLSNITRIRARAPRPRGAWRGVRRFGYDDAGAASGPAKPSEPIFLRIMRAALRSAWRAPCEFDLVVEAGRSSEHECQREIVEHVRRRGRSAASATAVTAAELTRLRAVLGKVELGVHDWRSLRSCAVSVGGDDVPLAGIDSQEAAIARIERHLHGSYESSAPANPLCFKALD